MRYKASQGQSLAEYALIAGIVSIGCIAGLTAFSGNLAQLLGNVQGNLIPKSVAYIPSSPSLNSEVENGNTGGTNFSPSLTGLDAIEPGQSYTLSNGQNVTLPAETAGSVGQETAYAIDSFSDKLLAVANSAESTSPAVAQDIRDLALIGYFLSMRQYIAATGDLTQSSGFKPSDKAIGLNDELSVKIGNTPEILARKVNGADSPFKSVADVQAVLPETLQFFTDQYQKVSQNLSTSSLSPQDKALVSYLGQTIVDKGQVITQENAMATDQKSDSLKTCSGGNCAP